MGEEKGKRGGLGTREEKREGGLVRWIQLGRAQIGLGCVYGLWELSDPREDFSSESPML